MTRWTRHLISLEGFFEAIHFLLSATLLRPIITNKPWYLKDGKKKKRGEEKGLLASGYFIMWSINNFPAVCKSNMEMREDD